MVYYRAYVIGPDGHVSRRVDLDCVEENAARDKARQLVDGHDIELWEGSCLVETFRHESNRGT